MANGMTPDDARREDGAALWRRCSARANDSRRSTARASTGAARRVVERVRAGFPLRAARTATQAVVRGRRDPHARTRHRRQRDDVRHRRPAALPAAAFLVAPGARVADLPAARTIEERRSRSYIGYRRYLDLREGTTSFDAMTPYYANKWPSARAKRRTEMSVGVSGRRPLEDVRRQAGDRPVLQSEEDIPPDGTQVVVFSYAFWQTEFGGRKDVLGTMLDIGPAKYTIIGVAPDGFTGFDARAGRRVHSDCRAAMRRSRGRSAESVVQDVQHDVVRGLRAPQAGRLAERREYRPHQRVSAELPDSPLNPKNTPLEIAKPHGSSAPVFAIAGPTQRSDAKVATWLIGVADDRAAHRVRQRRQPPARPRAAAPARDRGRIALGVSRARLLMQLMTESLVLAVLGGAAGTGDRAVGR